MIDRPLFIRGEKVVCVEPNPKDNTEYMLVKGKIYTVAEDCYSSGMITIEETGSAYFSYRFAKLFTDPPKKKYRRINLEISPCGVDRR